MKKLKKLDLSKVNIEQSDVLRKKDMKYIQGGQCCTAQCAYTNNIFTLCVSGGYDIYDAFFNECPGGGGLMC